MNPFPVVISHPTYVGINGTSVATPAATYFFFTADYQPPNQARSLEVDIVHNQNGRFKYVYDNGPAFKTWEPFRIRCEQAFATILGATAGQQYARLSEMWEYPGVLKLKTPDGTYSVHWAASNLERSFRAYPKATNELIEWDVVVQFEEAS